MMTLELLNYSETLRHIGMVMEGLDKVDRFSDGDSSPEYVVMELVAGKVALWKIHNGQRNVGFLITRIEEVPFGVRKLLIWEMYSKEKIIPEEYLTGMSEILMPYAKKFGCKAIIFYTTRDKGLEKLVGSYGFEREYTRFKKEV